MNARPAWPFDHPDLDVSIEDVRTWFQRGAERLPLRNPHIEPPVSESVKSNARPSGVLIGIVDRPAPTLLLTRRVAGIRFGSHVCFPGGTHEPDDDHLIETALRETEEEIALPPHSVEVLGCLGDYYTQTGYRITPVVGIVDPAAQLTPNPAEVDEIIEVEFARTFRASSYRISWRAADRGHIAYEEAGVRVAGPTVSLMIGLYEALLGIHAS